MTRKQKVEKIAEMLRAGKTEAEIQNYAANETDWGVKPDTVSSYIRDAEKEFEGKKPDQTEPEPEVTRGREIDTPEGEEEIGDDWKPTLTPEAAAEIEAANAPDSPERKAAIDEALARLNRGVEPLVIQEALVGRWVGSEEEAVEVVKSAIFRQAQEAANAAHDGKADAAVKLEGAPPNTEVYTYSEKRDLRVILEKATAYLNDGATIEETTRLLSEWAEVEPTVLADTISQAVEDVEAQGDQPTDAERVQAGVDAAKYLNQGHTAEETIAYLERILWWADGEEITKIVNDAVHSLAQINPESHEATMQDQQTRSLTELAKSYIAKKGDTHATKELFISETSAQNSEISEQQLQTAWTRAVAEGVHSFAEHSTTNEAARNAKKKDPTRFRETLIEAAIGSIETGGSKEQTIEVIVGMGGDQVNPEEVFQAATARINDAAANARHVEREAKEEEGRQAINEILREIKDSADAYEQAIQNAIDELNRQKKPNSRFVNCKKALTRQRKSMHLDQLPD